jgi:general secretion pathway protein M
VTIGGANLLQRVAGSVARFGGNILYTQVDLQGTQSKDGFVSVTVSCEVEQPALQQLLYDLEAGMPFLFVDQLVAQGPAVPGTTPEGKLRVLISVSGQWQGSK